jgi:hypothetical protein
MAIDTGKQTNTLNQVPKAAFTIEKGQETGVASQAPRLILWLFYVYIISSPFFGFSFANIVGRGLARVDWLVAGAILGVFFLGFIANRCPLRRSPTNGFVVLFVYTGILSIINLFNFNTSNPQFVDFGTKAAQLLFAAAFFFVISSIPMSEKELRSSLRLWIFVALVISLYAIYQVFALIYGWPLAYIELTNPSVIYGGGEARVIYGFAQVSSFFREPSYLGAYLLGPIILSVVFLLKDSGYLLLSKSLLMNWMILALLFLALLLTSSQAAYLSLLATIGFMYAAGWVGRIRTTKVVMAFLVFFILGGLLLASFDIDFLSAISLRFRYLILNMMNPTETIEITSFRVRSESILAALDVWASHPLLGVGLNNMRYHTDVAEFTLGWAQLLVDQGLLGTAALILVFWTLLRGLRKLSKETRLPPFWSIISLGLIFVLASDVVNGIFTYNWVDLQRWFNLAFANLVYIQAKSRLSVVAEKDSSRIDISLPGGPGQA